MGVLQAEGLGIRALWRGAACVLGTRESVGRSLVRYRALGSQLRKDREEGCETVGRKDAGHDQERARMRSCAVRGLIPGPGERELLRSWRMCMAAARNGFCFLLESSCRGDP